VEVDPAFQALYSVVEPLTPFAVELRYDTEFWPLQEDVDQAQQNAVLVKEFILERLRGSV
jgi:hypothetical protein